MSAAKDGSAAGDAVFLEDATVIFEPGTGETQSVLGSIADDFGNAASAGGSVIKIGAGTTILAGANIYAGTTAVTAGKLVIDGSNASSTLTSVQSGATLGGSGTVGTTTVNFGGILAPGNSIGILRFANGLNFAPGAIYEVDGRPAGRSGRGQQRPSRSDRRGDHRSHGPGAGSGRERHLDGTPFAPGKSY